MTDGEFDLDAVALHEQKKQIDWAHRYIDETYGTFDTDSLPNNMHDMTEFLLVRAAGLDPNNPQEKKTPSRFLAMLRELTTPTPFEFTMFDTDMDEMIIERDIQVASLCRHHVLPFMGVAHVAYIPNGCIAGLSKIPRAVLHCARSLQTQEELTVQIADFLEGKLEPMGVGVILEMEHTCMSIRGAQAMGTKTYTAAMRGVFGDHSKTAKAEFLARVNSK